MGRKGATHLGGALAALTFSVALPAATLGENWALVDRVSGRITWVDDKAQRLEKAAESVQGAEGFCAR